MKNKLLFILLYGCIGIPFGLLGSIYEASRAGVLMGRQHARTVFDEAMEQRRA